MVQEPADDPEALARRTLDALGCGDEATRKEALEFVRSKRLDQGDREGAQQLVMLVLYAHEQQAGIADHEPSSVASERLDELLSCTMKQFDVTGADRDRLFDILYARLDEAVAQYRRAPGEVDPLWLSRVYLQVTQASLLRDREPLPRERWDELWPPWWPRLFAAPADRVEQVEQEGAADAPDPPRPCSPPEHVLRRFAEEQSDRDPDVLRFLWDGHADPRRTVSLLEPLPGGGTARVSQLCMAYWRYLGVDGKGNPSQAALARRLEEDGIRHNRTTSKSGLDAASLTSIWNRALDNKPHGWKAALAALAAERHEGRLRRIDPDKPFVDLRAYERGDGVINWLDEGRSRDGGSEDE